MLGYPRYTIGDWMKERRRGFSVENKKLSKFKEDMTHVHFDQDFALVAGAVLTSMRWAGVSMAELERRKEGFVCLCCCPEKRERFTWGGVVC